MKEWLTNNKIYFDTISRTLLAIMAVIISFVSISISSNQLENEYNLNKPLIKVSSETFSYSGEPNDSRYLIISNEGSPITSFSSKLYTWIKIEANKSPFDANSERQTLYLPIWDYFGGTVSSNNFTGEMERYIGLKNNNLLYKIRKEFDDKYNEEFDYTFLSIVQKIAISFNDYKGARVNKLFEIDVVSQGYEINEDQETKGLIIDWNNDNKKYSIYSLTASDIREYIIKNGS